MKRIFIPILIAGLMFSVGVQAQISMKEAVETAHKANFGLKASALQVDAKESAVKSAYGRMLPEVKINFAYTRLNEDLILDLNPIRTAMIGLQTQASLELAKFKYQMSTGQEMPAQMQLQTAQKINAGLEGALPSFAEMVKQQYFPQAIISVQQPIFTGGKITAGIEAAKAQSDMEKAKDLGEIEAVSQETITAYLGVLLAAENVKVRTDVRDGMKKHAELADKMFAQGLIAKHDKLRADVALSDAERNLFEADQKLKIAKSALVSVLQSAKDITTSDTLFFAHKGLDEAYFMQKLYSGNPILQSLVCAKNALHQKSNVKYADYFPTVFAYGFYNVFDNYIAAIEPKWGVGIGASYNLFDGLRTMREYEEASSEEQAIDFKIKETERKLKLLVESKYMEMKLAEDRFRQLDASLEQAEENLRLNSKRHETGLGTSLEVIDAQLSLESIKLQRIKAQTDYWSNLSGLYGTVGNSDEFLAAWSGK